MSKAKVLAKRIKDYLKDNHIKESIFCQPLDYSSATISEMLNGKRKILADEYYIIVKTLGLPYEYFMEETEKGD